MVSAMMRTAPLDRLAVADARVDGDPVDLVVHHPVSKSVRPQTREPAWFRDCLMRASATAE